MVSHPEDIEPAFGQADLSNCEREQIHYARSIQPHGALLVVREPDQTIIQVSANAAAFLGLDRDLLGVRLSDLPGNLAKRLRPHLSDALSEIPRAVRCRVGKPLVECDGLLHRPPEGGLVIELERAGPSVELSRHVAAALQTVQQTSSLRGLCDETARLFKELTGYDRVMVYRFDEQGHGEVFSESRESELEPFLGNRYPASDIPQIARRLYTQNRIRVLVDIEYTPVPLMPQHSPLTGLDLDMSLCLLRSMSPIHIQYLKNMGVGATLVVSLMAGGQLWGLIACHHYSPRFVHYELRTVCELLAEAIGTRIIALESFMQAQAELAVRRLEQRMIEAISRDGDWRTGLFDGSNTLLQPLEASGAALLFESQVLTSGEVPGTQQLREIGHWLDRQPRDSVIATDCLGVVEPAFETLIPLASGLLATPISRTPGEYLLWFRPEQMRTVTWGGNPFKPMESAVNDPTELSPRKSFAKWHQVVKATAAPWTSTDRTVARLIGESVADVVLQFRSVRMLIAQDQLVQISHQVQHSEQPVVITDTAGRILLVNEAFEHLLQWAQMHPRHIEDLMPFFDDAAAVRRAFKELLTEWRAWRGEVVLQVSPDALRPLTLRADPVFVTPARILGFVLLFTDLGEQRAVEDARRRFQEGIIERHWATAVRLDSKADLVYRNLLSTVVDNAQLAALEITDGLDLAHMPEKLDSVQQSTTRSAELLAHLIWHATRSAKDEGRH